MKREWMKTQMLSITFKYADAMSNWEWRTQHCVVSSVEECKRIYGFDNGDVEYEILEVKEVYTIKASEI